MSAPPRAPTVSVSLNTRKAPPAKLSIPGSSSLSPNANAFQPDASLNVRNSLDSSRSDLTSLRSDITSLRISEFPVPPSVLPTIPASPRTPRSLYYSSTPTTPRSQHSFLQDVVSTTKVAVPSPKSLKGFFTRSNNSQSKLSEAEEQTSPQDNHDARSTRSNNSSIRRSPLGESVEKLPSPSPGASKPEDSSPANSVKSSQAALVPPASRGQPRSPSPLRKEEKLVDRSISPRPSSPPRAPLPVPPSNRNSLRNSARFSQILRQAPINMDVDEERLLSTDFISEMLRQPAGPSSSGAEPSARQVEHPLQTSDEVIKERHSPKRGRSNTESSSGTVRPAEASPSPLLFVPEETPMPNTGITSIRSSESVEYPPSAHRITSGLPSSVVPSGGDAIIFASPLGSPGADGADTLDAPSREMLANRGSYALAPSSAISTDSFFGASTPAGPQSRSPRPSWRGSSMSQMIASHLPIGISSGSQKTSRAAPKIRHHRYPRVPVQSRDSVQSTSTQSDGGDAVSIPSIVMATAVELPEESPVSPIEEPLEEVEEPVEQDPVSKKPRDTMMSVAPSSKSHATSTWTMRDSMTVPASIRSDYQTNVTDSGAHMSYLSRPFRRSHESLGGASSDYGRSTVEVGEIQIARKVEAMPDAMERTHRRSVVGIAPAVVIRHRANASIDNLRNTNASSSNRSLASPVSPQRENGVGTAPLSPREPPSLRSPPSHKTEVPESAKSLSFPDDALDGERHYLTQKSSPRDGNYWTAYPNAMSNDTPPKPSQSSFKSIISYISSRSRSGTIATRATRASHRSQKSTGSSRWAWLLRKPLPPLPPQAADAGMEDDKYHALGNDRADYQMSRISLGVSGAPQGWNDDVEKHPPPMDQAYPQSSGTGTAGLAGKFGMFGADSLKVARKKAERQSHQGEEMPPSARPLSSGQFSPATPQYNGQSLVYNHNPGKARSLSMFSKGRVRRKWLWIVLIAVAIVLIILIAVLATKLGRKKNSASTTCSNGMVGALCNLDPTCTCPAGGSDGTCSAPLAKSLSDLVPKTAQLFTTNVTAQGLATIIWQSQGTPSTPDCSSQAQLIDVGSVLSATAFPNRTQWAQAALVWNLFESGDINGTSKFRDAIGSMPFNTLSDDGIVQDPSNRFTVTSAGYIYDFAQQTVSPPSVTFKDNAAPSDKQLSELNGISSTVLDKMYSFASASSTQRQTALSTYWRAVLQLNPDDLPNFLRAFKSAPVMLPFDATSSPGGHSIASFLQSLINHTVSFPPPIACYPGLNSTQIQRINAVEGAAFSLDPIQSAPSVFDSSCFANRPVYGVLDVLRLRLPFADGRIGVAKQAVILNDDASIRAILHAGELLSALPGPSTTSLSDSSVDPRRFGTLSHVNHIALRWLQSFSSPNLAAEAAKYITTSPTVPPPSDSVLINATIPPIEVAVFGDVFLSDISSFVSSFSTPDGSLFFGSDQAQSFRMWALQASSASIGWCSAAFDSEVVREKSSINSDFELVWTGANGLIEKGNDGSQVVASVTNALGGRNLFSP